MRTVLVAAALVRRGDDLLLVAQSTGGAPYWSLPGGVVEPAETLADAAVREVAEETGVRITALGALAYLTEVHWPDHRVLAAVFEADGWLERPAGPLRDPSGEVVAAEFVPPSAVAELLATSPSAAMSEPLLAYLAGDRRTHHLFRMPGRLPTAASAR